MELNKEVYIDIVKVPLQSLRFLSTTDNANRLTSERSSLNNSTGKLLAEFRSSWDLVQLLERERNGMK